MPDRRTQVRFSVLVCLLLVAGYAAGPVRLVPDLCAQNSGIKSIVDLDDKMLEGSDNGRS